MVGRCALRHHQPAAKLAFKAFGAGVGLIIALLKGTALVFSVHGDLLYGVFSIIAHLLSLCNTNPCLQVKSRVHEIHIFLIQFLPEQLHGFAETGSMKQCYL
jgi:hypothetical protein